MLTALALGERLVPLQVLGAIGVLGGVVLLAWPATRGETADSRPRNRRVAGHPGIAVLAIATVGRVRRLASTPDTRRA